MMLLLPPQVFAGTITGTVVDHETGEPLIGVNVVIQNSTSGASTDLDGAFTISGLASGRYTMLISSLGYKTLEMEVDTGENGFDPLRIEIHPEVTRLQDVTVTVKHQGSTETLLEERIRATMVKDELGGDEVSKMPGSDVSDVVHRATGVSTTGGDPIIRGLDARYSKITLNSAHVSGTEPNRSAVSLALFPASMMSRLTITKSYSVDKMGEFGGGNINMDTWNAMGTKELGASVSTSVNSQTTFQKFLSYDGGAMQFLGFDDGTRALPDAIQHADKKLVIGGIVTPGYTHEELSNFGQSFRNIWSPQTGKAVPNLSLIHI